MSSQTFKVSVDKVFFDIIRGKQGEHDNDWATLAVTTLKDGHTRSWSGYQLASEIISGALVEDLQPPLELTDFVLDDDDGLLITLSIVNQASDGTLRNALLWSASELEALGVVVGALGALNSVVVAIKEGAMEVAIGKAIDEVFGSPECDGLVFNRSTYLRTVAQLMQDTHGEVGRGFTFPADPYTEKNSKGCGLDPVTRVNLSITLTANDPDFGALPPGSVGPPGPPVKIKSLSAAPGNAWGGRWEDAKSRIFCNIAATEPSVPAPGNDGTTAVVNAAASSVTLPLLLTRLGTDPRNPPRDVARSSGPANEVGAPSGVVFETPPSALTGPAGLAGGLTGGGAGSLSTSEGTVLAAIWRFSVNVTEVIPSFGGGRNVATENDLAVAVPMVVISRTDDHYASLLTSEEGVLQRAASEGVVFEKPPPAFTRHALEGVVFEKPPSAFTGPTGLAGGLASGGGAAGTNQIAPALVPPELGATIPVSNNVFLQLYAGYDARGRFVDYQIRYLRTEGSGEVASDVMLTRQEKLG